MSKDIGEYNTRPHLCHYCYANTNNATAMENWKRHCAYPHAETILRDENRGNAIYPARGIPMFLNVALSLFERMGIRRIAMNRILVYWLDGVRDHGHLAEAFLLDGALQWLDTYEHHFESTDW